MTDNPTDDAAEVWLDRGARRYRPGEILTGSYRLAAWREAGLSVAELSVLWYTAGQGEEDFFVHHFERRPQPKLPGRSDETPNEFSCVLPASPLSYDGQIVRVCWAVRLRGFFAGGRQRTVEVAFLLASSEGRE